MAGNVAFELPHFCGLRGYHRIYKIADREDASDRAIVENDG